MATSSRTSTNCLGPGDEGGGCGPGDHRSVSPSPEKPRSVFGSLAVSAEGWVQIVGGGFPKPQGLSGGQTVTYRHMSNIFSEVTHSRGGSLGLEGQGPVDAGRPLSSCEPGQPGPRRDDFAWLSSSFSLLFFFASPMASPYAMIELPKVCISEVKTDSRILTLVGNALVDGEGDLAATGNASAGTVTSLDVAPSVQSPSPGKKGGPVTIVLLLPDGRWQELTLPKLELCVQTPADLQMWNSCFSIGTPSSLRP